MYEFGLARQEARATTEVEIRGASVLSVIADSRI
jgi:hypothetical protein